MIHALFLIALAIDLMVVLVWPASAPFAGGFSLGLGAGWLLGIFRGMQIADNESIKPRSN